MNILFLLRSLDLGGLEVVTAVLANKFLKEGHQVAVFAFETRTGNVRERFDERINFTIGEGYKNSRTNVVLLRRLLQESNVDVVINQWGLPLIPIKVLNKARRGLNVRVISVYHNDPLRNGRIQSVETAIVKTESAPIKALLRAKKFAFRCITGYAMRYIYCHSDCFAVLSPSFIPHFQQFTRISDTSKLIVQTNPVTISSEGYKYESEQKQKEIIYVGRIDYTQKRVHRVIETWAHLEHRFPDWHLTIVGDGPERENMERIVADLELHHVHFEGFQAPKPYYERASILLLTSEFEGFPLVLAECMSFGVVPVVYGSYAAVYDIIENGKDGFVLPFDSTGFRAEQMAQLLAILIEDKSKCHDMAMAAIQKSRDYSLDMIYRQWMEVLSVQIEKDEKNRIIRLSYTQY